MPMPYANKVLSAAAQFCRLVIAHSVYIEKIGDDRAVYCNLSLVAIITV